MATLDGARASPFGDETLAARAEEAFDALRSAAPVCRRRRGIALYGIARAHDAPRSHAQCCCGVDAEQSAWTVPASLAGVATWWCAIALPALRQGSVAPMPATWQPKPLLALGRLRWVSRRCVAWAGTVAMLVRARAVSGLAVDWRRHGGPCDI